MPNAFKIFFKSELEGKKTCLFNYDTSFLLDIFIPPYLTKNIKTELETLKHTHTLIRTYNYAYLKVDCLLCILFTGAETDLLGFIIIIRPTKKGVQGSQRTHRIGK